MGRQLVGLTSFHLMLTHVLVINVGYRDEADGGLLAQAWLLITTYPGMVLATAAVVLLVGVTVTSLRFARRRLRYEPWHLLHLYAYLGVGLAVPHQLWAGTEFATSPAARAYLTALYGVTAAVVVVFRLGLPAWRTLRHQLRVTHVVPEAPGAMSVYLHGRRLDRLPARAGQFFLWRFRAGRGWSRRIRTRCRPRPRRDTCASR